MSADQFEAAQRLAAIVESSDDAIISKDLNGIIQTWNKGAERIFGYTAAEAVGKPITIVIPKELHGQEPEFLRKIAHGEGIDGFETVRQRKDGSQFHVSLTISPIKSPAGKVVGASKIARDITELRRSQERQEMLLREMNHRVKNLFAVASGVVALSVRSATTPAQLAAAIQSRLAALSRAHELILPSTAAGMSGSTVMLPELVHTILSPYDSADRPLTIEGPALECGSVASTSFALLLHEFATNSVKYGALAGPNGRVSVKWALDSDALDLTWSEERPVSTEADQASGFGTFLVEATARSMAAMINRVWSPQGLTIEIKIPRDRLGA